MYHRPTAPTATVTHEFGRGQPLKAAPQGRIIGARVRTFHTEVKDFPPTKGGDDWKARRDAGWEWEHTATVEGLFYGFDTRALRDGEVYGSSTAGSARFFSTEDARDKAVAKYLKALEKAAPTKR